MTLHRLLVFLLSLSILSLAPPAAAAAGRAAPIGVHAAPTDHPSAPVILFEQAMVPALPQEAVPIGAEPEAAGGEDVPAVGLLPHPGGLGPLLAGGSNLVARESIAGGRPWPTGPPRA